MRAATHVCSLRRLSSKSTRRHPLKRLDIYSKLEDQDVAFFQRLLGSNRVVTSDDEMVKFNVDWMEAYRGSSRCAVLPESNEQVSAVVRHCVERRLAICVQGGNTGLVGGSVPVFDEIVLSTTRLNKNFEFDDVTGVMNCQSGWILEELNCELSKFGFMMPIDLGAKGSCQLGGVVATGAGGLRFLRYGSLHAHLLGLTAVMADEQGSAVSFGSTVRKDNTGFHQHQLFVGSEGQLGVITDVTLTAVPQPASVQLALFAVASFDACRLMLRLARRYLCEILSSFEFMDAASLRCLEENAGIRHPLHASAGDAFALMLVETHGSSVEHDSEKLANFLAVCYEGNLVIDGTLAASEQQAEKFWQTREGITPALHRDGYVWKHDISLNVADYYDCVKVAKKLLGGLEKRVVCYGHLADGNAHLNVTADAYSDEIQDRLYPALYDWVASRGGSVSAEHGLGLAKRHYIHYSKSAPALYTMGQLKRTFDPKLILNPYKTIPVV